MYNMKKILLLAATFCMGFAVTAQQGGAKGLLNVNDTLSSASTSNYPQTVTGTRQAVTYQVDVVKISGTVAGTVNWQRSISGTSKYVTVSTSTITDATNQYAYSFTPSTGDNYRVQVVNTTGSFSYKVYYLYR